MVERQLPKLQLRVTAARDRAGFQVFRCINTEALFFGKRIARFANIESVALRKWAVLNRVVRVEELRIPQQNRLESLKGDRRGQWSVRINDQWRLCFRWEDGAAWDVEIVDYH